MDKADVVATVKRLGATAKKPVLTDADVSALVDGYAIVDAAGNAPGAAGWTATYDVNGAVAEVWRTKAGQVAGDFTFTADDSTFNKGDVLANMLMMESKYDALSAADRTARTGSASTLDTSRFGGTNATLDQIAASVIP
jgi:hypothetical protein